MALYDGPIFDGDTHILEDGLDFFKAYVPKEHHEALLPWQGVGPSGEYGLHVGSRRVLNHDIHPEGLVAPPGQLKAWLRAMKEGKAVDDGWGPPTADQFDRDVRIRKLDEFGVEACMLFPGNFNLAVGYLTEDAAGMSVMHAYNRWLHEKWGFAYQNRIFTAGMLALWDTELAVAEAEWLIERGVRVVVAPMGPAQGKSLAHPDFDPVWARLNEAGVVLAFHLQEATFMHPMLKVWGEKPLQSRMHGQTAWQWMFAYGSLPVRMVLANVIFHNFFARFPNIGLVSVENGASWLPDFLVEMDKARGVAKNGHWPCGQLKERPSAIFKAHCSVVAYPEDPVQSIIERIGTAKCLLMGSDYPHPEGVAAPRLFADVALRGVAPADMRAVMYENARRLVPDRARRLAH